MKWPSVILRSYSQLLFSDNLWTGLAVALAFAMISATSLLFSAVGLLVSSLTALLLGQDREAVASGLYGYCGALFGLFWSWYFLVSFHSLSFFVLFALCVAPAQILLTRILTGGHQLPVTGLPAALLFIAALFAIYAITVRAALVPASALYLPLGDGPPPLLALFPDFDGPLIRVVKTYHLHAWALLLLGLLFHSRVSFMASALGVAAGTVLAFLPPFSALPAPQVFVGFNALPLALGLAGVFILPTGRAVLFAFGSLLACALLWLGLSLIFTPLLLPVLTLPFNLTLLLALTLAKKGRLDRYGILALPLLHVSPPESNRPSLTRPVSPAHPLRAGSAPSSGGLEAFVAMLSAAHRIAILSGAGTSTESGIPDIRGRSVFWERFRPDIFLIENFLRREDLRKEYWAMEGMFRRLVLEAVPNHVHRSARRLEDLGKLECVITQNVDGLFQRAGISPSRVIEIHGSAHRVRCLGCGALYERKAIAHDPGEGHSSPRCRTCSGILKPDTVFMGEEVGRSLLGEAIFRTCASDLLLIIGTTLVVEPVASIPRIAAEKGIPIVIVNLTPTPMDPLASLVIREPAGAFLGKAMAAMS